MAVQVDTDPIPHVIVDVRKPDEVAYNPLPQDLMGGVNIPGRVSLARDCPLVMAANVLHILLTIHQERRRALLQAHWQPGCAAHAYALK